MKEILNLNAGWKMDHTEYCGNTVAVPKLKWAHDGTVPGDVHLDLMRVGEIPDPFVGMNADQSLWMEAKDWWFRREFDSPENLPGRRAMLVFHGLDCFATIWVNNKIVGQSANMFIRHEFDVTDALKPGGRNELVVRLASTTYSAQVDPAHKGLPIWSPERLFCRKPSMIFGWDIAPRLVTVGIWRPVELVLIDQARITDFRVALVRFDGPNALVRVEVETEWIGAQAGEARLAGAIHGTTWDAQVALKPGKQVYSTEILVKKAPRWLPIGYGKPMLCEASVALASAGRKLDERTITTGLRTIEIVQEPQLSGATSFRFRCNGRDIFITGLNWTPLDAIFARITPERLTKTVEKVAGIGCNMLRMWGGGIYEEDHFYAECDRLGLLVWHDFMLACAWYPQTDAFAATIEAEARQVVRDLRNHPCIAVWAGDNEIDMAVSWLNDPTVIATENRLNREVLPRVCRELDPAVPYIPSSPYSPSGAPFNDEKEGDTHLYRHGKNWRECELWTIRSRFMSEFGRLSLPSMSVIKKYFPKGTEWPLTNAMWRYHGADTTHTGIFRVTDKVLDELKACGKPAPANVREAVKASQELQSEGVIELIERYCSDPEFGGFLLWNVSDCWPQQSDSVLDCDGNPKIIFKKLGPLFKKVRAGR